MNLFYLASMSSRVIKTMIT